MVPGIGDKTFVVQVRNICVDLGRGPGQAKWCGPFVTLHDHFLIACKKFGSMAK